MPTVKQMEFIQDNIYIPQPGEYTDAHDDLSDYRVVEVWEDDHYRVPQMSLIIHKDHYDSFLTFLQSLPEQEQYAELDTRPYWRSDDVVGPAIATTMYYMDPVTQESIVVGYDDYPVICLDTNGDAYIDECEEWTVEGEITA